MNDEKKLNFHFYNTLCSKSTYNMLFNKHGVNSGNAAQTFLGLIADGLNQNMRSSYYSQLPDSYKFTKSIYIFYFINE